MMFKKSAIFICILLFGVFIIIPVSAEPVVELAAPRSVPKIVDTPETSETPPSQVQQSTQESQDKTSIDKTKAIPKKTKKRSYRKYRSKKINYDKISKLIEYGYYNQADNLIDYAIKRNKKNIKALSLRVISYAKQLKLDPAQKELDILLKKYPDNSNLHYAQGIVYYQRTTSSNMFYRSNSQKLLEDSLSEFNKAIDLDNKNARAYNAAGVINLKLGNKQEALDCFNKAIDIDKTYSMAIDNLGTMDFLDGKYEDAENKFQKALKYNTQNTTAMYHLAQVEMQKKDYTKALIYLNNALYINPNSAAIYNLMGKAYLIQGNEAAAINAFKQSVFVKPEFTLSYLDLANIYEKRGDSEFAIEQLKTALSINPNYNDAQLKLADISLSIGKYDQAVETYLKLVGIDGYNDFALKGLANSYYGQAQTASNKALLGSNQDLFKALDCINKAIAANNQDLELHLAKLRLTKLTNQPDLSKVELNNIIQSPDNDLMSNIIKGEAYFTMNDYINAQEYFNSAIALSSNINDDLYLMEILIYHKQYENAEKMIQKILAQDPENKEALNSIDYIQKSKKCAENYFKSAQFFAKSKNLTTAMEYLSRSLAINPNNPEAHLLLAKLYEKQKDYYHAVINYKIYLSLNPNSSKTQKLKHKIKKLENRL